MEQLMEQLTNIVVSINGVMWDSVLLILLCGTGIFFTLRLGFIQIRRFPAAFKRVFGNFDLTGQAAGNDGMSSFQALATAMAAQVGTGNLTGAATAITMGGPGAILWMWLSAFFGMSTIFAEATLAQKYRKMEEGQITGGPVYYIRAAFKGNLGKILSALFAIFLVAALGFIGNMVQSNSVGDAFNTAFGVSPVAVGFVVAAISFFIFTGGIKRIASFTEKLVPIMAGLYIVGGIAILVANASQIIPALTSIFVCAFKPQAIMGGVVGVTVKQTVRYGVARGLFSNEAGMGSTPHAHAVAKVKHPCDQGEVAIMGVFIDTFVVLTLTALVILTTGAHTLGLSGIAVTQSAFSALFGSGGNIFIAVCLFFFALSTIVGWYFFGETNIRYLFGKKAVLPYSLLVCAFIVLGSALKVDFVWELADMFNGFMVIPNLLALLALTGVDRKSVV